MKGAVELLSTLAKATSNSTGDRIELAIATSSGAQSFSEKTRHLENGLFEHFPSHHRILGNHKGIQPGRGKPCPDIYQIALQTINQSLPHGRSSIMPVEVLVFEDSVPGVEAARRAGMQCVWVPQAGLAEVCKGLEHNVLAGEVRQENDLHTLATWNGAAEQLAHLGEIDLRKYGIVIAS